MRPEELTTLLDAHDSLVSRCASGTLSVLDFVAQYGSFPYAYALDGHEDKDQSDRRALAEAKGRIAFHFALVHALQGLCAEADFVGNPAYRSAGRFGNDEAIARLRRLLAEYPNCRIEEGM